MTQTDIFALEKQKDQAIRNAEMGADFEWFDEATEAVEVLIRRGEEFTSDRVWQLMKHTGLKTPEPRAMGAVIRQFVKAKKIRQVGYRPSSRPECHRRPLAVWVSA